MSLNIGDKIAVCTIALAVVFGVFIVAELMERNQQQSPVAEDETQDPVYTLFEVDKGQEVLIHQVDHSDL
ncbi:MULTISPECIES: hypothetical protein [Pseudovibrio]|uniref:hypothetical protein n=1 Tax=Stappiaceae TaxID=2821832 RepID=UPI002365C140|nr:MULTISPECIES: hypothetical protein [Pseudovibrio]MDD7911060.1 hypothetical protein [Pseudovibrio exalbescens]MDX5595277.1 hypothetical protein [Pseudovibrio sp. SPO723]